MKFKRVKLKCGIDVYVEWGNDYAERQLRTLETKASLGDTKFGNTNPFGQMFG